MKSGVAERRRVTTDSKGGIMVLLRQLATSAEGASGIFLIMRRPRTLVLEALIFEPTTARTSRRNSASHIVNLDWSRRQIEQRRRLVERLHSAPTTLVATSPDGRELQAIMFPGHLLLRHLLAPVARES